MGCITSKVMTRSGSYQEELSRSLKGRHQGFPALEELLISRSRKGGDQFIALVCNVDEKKPTKISSESIDNSESMENIINQSDDLNLETINAWDMMAGLDEQVQQEEDDIHKHIYSETKLAFPPRDEFEGSTDITRRSKSLHWLSSDHESFFVIKEHNEESGGNINSVRCCRSFHTVDEYDAIMMERNGWSNTKAKIEWEDRLENYLTNIKSPSSLTGCEDIVREDKSYNIESGDIGLKANNLAINNTEDVVAMASSNIVEDEKKVSRMARTKSLSIPFPSTIEFPSFKGWYDDTETDSTAGDNNSYYYYVTPRFGSFGLPAILPSTEVKEEYSVFDPPMVSSSSYKVTKEQLEVEEEFLLKLINT